MNKLKKYELFKGDCLEVMKSIESCSIDLILCDLPYGTTACKWDSIIDLDALWKEYNRIIKPNGMIVLFSAQPFTTKLISSNIKQYKYSWYWLKNNVTGFTFAKYQPMRKVEDINVFYKSKPLYNPQGLIKLKKPVKRVRKKVGREVIFNQDKLTGDYITKFTNYPNNVLEFKKETKCEHPTQKPVDLLEYLIKTYSDEGMLVLDNCMGSGSTGVACGNTGRRFIGIEMDEEYFNIANRRITKAYIDNKRE